MFDFCWLRPNEAEHLQPYDRLNASGTRWPRRNGKFSNARAPHEHRGDRDTRR